MILGDAKEVASISRKLPPPEKPIINERLPKDVIEYQGRVFEVPPEIISYLSRLPDVLAARIERTMENGMGYMYPNGTYGCGYCNHYASNIANMFSGREETVIPSLEREADTSVRGCQYKRTVDVRWATAFREEDSRIAVTAQKMPCVVDDCRIAELVERGLLDEYEVKREFDFPTLAELNENSERQKKYEIPVPRKRNLFGIISDFFGGRDF